VPNAFGAVTITVPVNGGGASNNITPPTFAVMVNPVNDPPTLNPIANFPMPEDTVQTVTLLGITAGPANENQTVTITARSGDTNLLADPTVAYTSPATSGTLTLNPVTNAVGSTTITVTVNDGAASNN